MAPLKHFVHFLSYPHSNRYPWLKGHGSFEAIRCLLNGQVMQERYPWLKGHGSFEAPVFVVRSLLKWTYPWLKGHGSFEAQQTARLISLLRSRIHG